MHVDTSPKLGKSNSRTLAAYFVELLRERIAGLESDYLDLSVDTPPHVTRDFAVATYTPEPERTPEMKATLAASDALCQRLLNADALLFSLPMYNWSMPSAFKAFIDAIVRTNITYKYVDGKYVGQLSRQKVLFVTSRGVDLRPGTPWAHYDALTPALRAAFGFIGVADPKFVDAQPMQFADQEARAAGYARARTELAVVADEWAGAFLRPAAMDFRKSA